MAFSSKRMQKRKALFQNHPSMQNASNSSTSHLEIALKTIERIRESTSKKRKRRNKATAKNALILDHQLLPMGDFPDLPLSTIDHESQSQFTQMPMSDLMFPASRSKKSDFLRIPSLESGIDDNIEEYSRDCGDKDSEIQRGLNFLDVQGSELLVNTDYVVNKEDVEQLPIDFSKLKISIDANGKIQVGDQEQFE